MSTSTPPDDVQLSVGELELLARARQQRERERVPDALRQRLLGRALEDAAPGPRGLAAPAIQLTVVPKWSLRASVGLVGGVALAVLLLLQVRQLVSEWAQTRALEAEARPRRTPAASVAAERWLDTPLFRAPAPTLPSGEPPPAGLNLFNEQPFSMRSAAWQVRRWDNLSVGPAGAAAHELVQGGLCVSLGAGERVLGGWPWAASDSVAPKGVVLEPGKPYRLFFKAWAREPLPAQLLVGVGHTRLPFSAAAGARVPVTTEPQSFVVDFTSEQGDPSVGVAFLATGADDDERTRVCLSEMTLTER